MKIPKTFLPDDVRENHLEIIKNISLLENLFKNGWDYDNEVNLYKIKAGDIYIFVGLTLMSDDNLWGRVYINSLYNEIGNTQGKLERFFEWSDLCERINRGMGIEDLDYNSEIERMSSDWALGRGFI